MAAEVRRVALPCPALPKEAAEVSVVPLLHQTCQQKTPSLGGFCAQGAEEPYDSHFREILFDIPRILRHPLLNPVSSAPRT